MEMQMKAYMEANMRNEQHRLPSFWRRNQPRHHSLFSSLTRKGHSILFWRPEPISDEVHQEQLQRGYDTRYACHALTIGSHLFSEGPFTPYGACIDTILEDEFSLISEENLQVGDVIAWRDEEDLISHTARITELYWNQQNTLANETRLCTKNGSFASRSNMRLASLISLYGDKMAFYRETPYNLRPRPCTLDERPFL
jgi:hypothetical protein